MTCAFRRSSSDSKTSGSIVSTEYTKLGLLIPLDKSVLYRLKAKPEPLCAACSYEMKLNGIPGVIRRATYFKSSCLGLESFRDLLVVC